MSAVLPLYLRVTDIRAEARDVMSLALAAEDGTALPSVSAGSHLDIELRPGLIRSYSICAWEGDGYRVGVGLNANGRGGSRHVHHRLRVGDALRAGLPRNHFPLATGASRHVFVAGGIGITPLLAMARACQMAAEDWTLIYCARSRLRAAFLDELVALGGRDRVETWFAEEDGAAWDAAARLSAAPAAGEHVYCCGPGGLMQAVADATRHYPPAQVHFEWFAAPAAEVAPAGTGPQPDRGFQLRLARSGMNLTVGADETVLACLERAGVEVPWSCREGLCGSCQAGVLAGDIDHRDMVLSTAEQQAGSSMMVCVSRARGECLTLDL